MSTSRRGFLKVSVAAGGGLLIGFPLACGRRRPAAKVVETTGDGQSPPAEESLPADGELNAWIHIAGDDTVTFRVNESEMGQGVLTAFAMILGEELRADMNKIRAVHAPTDAGKYGRLVTGGSYSVRGNYDRLRTAGAAAREMLRLAAAKHFGVPVSECQASNGQVSAGGQHASFGLLAAAAAEFEAPADPPLTDPADFKVIGTPLARLDTPDKVTGKTVFGIDVRIEGMLYAVVARSPIFGGKVASFNDTAARAVSGVSDVVEIPTGIAVVASNSWAAITGREALDVQWDPGVHGKLSSKGLRAACMAAMNRARVAESEGAVKSAFAKAPRAKRIEAIYEVPYLAHVPMEPLSATARVKNGEVDVWASTQAPSPSQELAAEIAGVSMDKVRVHTQMLGGGFGRRSHTDFVGDAVHLAVKTGKTVQVLWTREDGVRGGQYRPMSVSRMRGAIDSKGLPTVWQHQVAGPSLLAQFGDLPEGIDRSMISVAKGLPYRLANREISYAQIQSPVTTWFWRSVGASQNGFACECFLDELIRLGNGDPLDVRRKLLAESPRHLKVLDMAAQKAQWGQPLPAGTARGLALVESFGSVVAQVAEVSIAQGKIKVARVVCAIDCGPVINPNTLEAQMESAIVYGLSAALYGEITLEAGATEQGNFDDYRILRLRDMPVVEVHRVSPEPGSGLGGVGEPAVPPIAAAVANGVAQLTGKPVRSLPIRLPS